MDLMKIRPDKERARSLMKLAELRHEKIKTYDEKKESSLIVEGYYEIIKELITAILFIDGYKTLSHKDLIEYLSLNYKKDFSYSDLSLIDQFRKYRNKIVYYGIFIEASFLNRNKQIIKNIIEKLFKICRRKLE